MTTPIIMLALLIGPYLLVRISEWLGAISLSPRTAACVGVAAVFCFTGVGHFIQTDALVQMLPPWVPQPATLVYLTGIIEFVGAAAILVPALRPMVGWGLILMLLAFLPVNLYAAMQRVGIGGHQWGPSYLLIRVPLQAILIAWIWWFAVRPPMDTAETE
jgi:uncharacterized membrane protein